MPIRTASMAKRISANGQALHRAMANRGTSDKQPTQAESALLEERKLLKEERDKRKAQALEPRPRAIDRLVRTHRSAPKDRPEGRKETQGASEASKPKARRSRAEKQAEKAAAMDAARKSSKKPAATK